MKKIQHIFTNDETIDLASIFCIGRNYSAHAREMGAEVPSEPLIFLKPRSAYFNDKYEFTHPEFTKEIHHEVELVIVMGEDCFEISAEQAKTRIAGFGIGIDFTARDIQAQLKEKGHPWARSKGFYQSAPVSKIIPFKEFDPLNFDIELKKNGTSVQKGNSHQMERNVFELIEEISKIFYLQRGDCIFTGTPEGVGKINKGDTLELLLNNQLMFSLDIK